MKVTVYSLTLTLLNSDWPKHGVLAVLSAIVLSTILLLDRVWTHNLQGQVKQLLHNFIIQKTVQSELEEISGVNPIALRMAKTLWSFGHSECNRVKTNLMLDLLNDKIINSPLQTGIVNFL